MRRGDATIGGMRGLDARKCKVPGDSVMVGVDVAVGFGWLGDDDGDGNDDDVNGDDDDDDAVGADGVVAIWDRVCGWRLARVDGFLC